MPANDFDILLTTLRGFPEVTKVVRRQEEGGIIPRAVVYLTNGRILSVIKIHFNFVVDENRPFEVAELSSDLSLFNNDEIHGYLTAGDVIEVVGSFIGRTQPTAAMLSHRRVRRLKI